jgi:hypothetical protein
VIVEVPGNIGGFWTIENSGLYWNKKKEQKEK